MDDDIKKHLIIPGTAKSGTTFLWDQLVNGTDRVNYFSGKELGYLSVGDDVETYEKCFDRQGPGKVFLDATPQYSDTYLKFSENAARALKGREVQILFCLRDPVARAFSHYRHDLSTNFWTSVMGDYSFHTEQALRRYMQPYLPIVEAYQNAFGVENVHGFSFKQSTDRLPSKVLDLLGLPQDWRLNLDHNPALGGGLPRVVYNEKRDVTIEEGGKFYRLPAKTLLVCTTMYSDVYSNYPVEIAEIIQRHMGNWTPELDRSIFGSAWDEIQADYSGALEALSMAPETVKRTGMIGYKSYAAISPEVLSGLEEVGDPQDIVSKIYEEAKTQTPWTGGNEFIPDKHIELVGQVEKVQRVFKTQNNLPERIHELRRSVNEFGPIPSFLNGYIMLMIGTGKIDEAIRVVERQPFAGLFLDVPRIKERLESPMENVDLSQLARLAALCHVTDFKPHVE